MKKEVFDNKIKTATARWQKANPNWQIDNVDYSEDERLYANTIIHFPIGDNQLQSVIISWAAIDNEFETDENIYITNQNYPGYEMRKGFGSNLFELYNPKDRCIKSDIGIDAAVKIMTLGNFISTEDE